MAGNNNFVAFNSIERGDGKKEGWLSLSIDDQELAEHIYDAVISSITLALGQGDFKEVNRLSEFMLDYEKAMEEFTKFKEETWVDDIDSAQL